MSNQHAPGQTSQTSEAMPGADKKSQHTNVPVNEVLSQPLQVGDYKIKNRVVMASLTRNRAYRTVPDEVNARYYSQRATAGLILSEGTFISPQGSEWPDAACIFNEAHVQGWKKVTDAVHKEGGLIFCQLWHIGRVAHPLHQCGLPPIGPSAVKAAGGKFRLLQGEPGYVEPVAIDRPELIIEQYRRAAELCKKAGFDGVEVHSANGYLPHQFLDSTANIRTDEWGGSPQKRCKFTLAAIDAAIDVYGAGKVGIKLSPSGGFNDVGDRNKEMTTEQYSYLVDELNKRGIAYVQLMNHLDPFDPEGRGTTIDNKALGKRFTKGAVFLNGGYDGDSGAKEVHEGYADAIVFGRHFIANPDLPQRLFKKEKIEETDMKTW